MIRAAVGPRCGRTNFAVTARETKQSSREAGRSGEEGPDGHVELRAPRHDVLAKRSHSRLW